jgi:hypothetical protein
LGNVHAAAVLPDLIAWASQAKSYMYNGNVDPSLVPGETVYRFTGALPNIGAGKLEVREVTHPDATQDVYQRIFTENGQLDHERLIGSFPNADSVAPRHLWLPGIAQYNLRTVLADNEVGPIVASHDKTSMAVVDSDDYDTSLPGAPPASVYNSVAAPMLGISIGWADVYGANLPGQWVPATGLADGQYWLEVFVDPYDQIEESDETNNVTQILVNLQVPEPTILAGDYNRDGAVDAADYTVWRDTLGQNVLSQQGKGADGDASGTIRQADYEVWKAHFGEASGGGSVAVPEPTSVTFAMIALVVAGRLLNRGRARHVNVQLGA